MTDSPSTSGTMKNWLKTMASPAIVFYTLPWLMVLLVLGTVAQRDLGIYTAQKLFFSSWILWWGPMPLPGGYITLGILTVCLLAKFLLYSPWSLNRAGTILTHLGILILLCGGILTAASQEEGFIAIGEGQTANAISDYHHRVLTIEKDDEVFATLPFDSLKTGTLSQQGIPFNINIEDLCTNCRPAPIKQADGRHGFAELVTLIDTPPEKEDETNLSGMTLKFSGLPDNQDGIYAVMEEIPHKPTVTINDQTYSFHIGRRQTTLPFSIELKNFTRDVHPGTDMARGFSSDIIVHDGAVEWPSLIRMNEPLRYKGYTFYQASFSIRPDGEYSVLSVVTNKGRVFPYLASIIIFLGLLTHLVLRLKAAREPS